MLSDGVTLYYSSTSSESLGGYDIYVTRYNTDTQKYLKSENMGMPYNSLYNDYFLAIDEANQLGWLVSDRYQPEGKVCVYLFVHDETRNVYSTDDDTDNLRHLAVIHDIASTQVENKNIAVAAKQRYKNLLASLQNSKEEKNEFTFPVYNGIVYHNMNDFKSSEAKQMATNWRELTLKRTAIITELSKNRKKYLTNTSLRGTIIKQENALEQLDDTIKDLEWNIRYEEQSKLTNELAAIEAQTEQKIEDINLAKKIEGPINEEELQKKCSIAVEKFLKDINNENGFGINLPIKIEYQNMKINKTILNENVFIDRKHLCFRRGLLHLSERLEPGQKAHLSLSGGPVPGAGCCQCVLRVFKRRDHLRAVYAAKSAAGV